MILASALRSTDCDGTVWFVGVRGRLEQVVHTIDGWTHLTVDGTAYMVAGDTIVHLDEATAIRVMAEKGRLRDFMRANAENTIHRVLQLTASSAPGWDDVAAPWER